MRNQLLFSIAISEAAFSARALDVHLPHSSTGAAQPAITEFMAANTATLADEDGAFSDWLEIHNPDASPINLAGWFLTDTAGAKTKWQFPAVTVPGDGYIVVWASNKNRRTPGSPLHTNFALSAGGEYLGLIEPDGATVVSDYAPTFPAQSNDISYGRLFSADGDTLDAGYFRQPTPGRANGEFMLLALVTLSRPAGPFPDSFLLQLAGAGAGDCPPQTQGVGAGMAQTGSTSTVLKSAGETISRYSMSGE